MICAYSTTVAGGAESNLDEFAGIGGVLFRKQQITDNAGYDPLLPVSAAHDEIVVIPVKGDRRGIGIHDAETGTRSADGCFCGVRINAGITTQSLFDPVG